CRSHFLCLLSRCLARVTRFPYRRSSDLDGAYAPNARYWLGESYYVTQNYDLALEQFQLLYQRYPDHDKAPGALLKIGLSQYGLRSEEHTSELQSREKLVCRLLLEKKKII